MSVIVCPSSDDRAGWRRAVRPHAGPLLQRYQMVALARTADPARCRELVRRDGAAVLTGLATDTSAAIAGLGAAVFGAGEQAWAEAYLSTEPIRRPLSTMSSSRPTGRKLVEVACTLERMQPSM